jgi:phytanoyl-CoA hydroxylase
MDEEASEPRIRQFDQRLRSVRKSANRIGRNKDLTKKISDAQWAEFDDKGYLALGKLLGDDDLAALQARIDAIMLGSAPVDYSKIYMQLDSETGEYESLVGGGLGWKGATLNYRKIQNLEHDDLFREYMERPIFREISEHFYGEGSPITCFRAMFMNKPANRGTLLPWHQDAWVYLDRQPLVTTWTALDPATIANGCVEVVPGTHKLGRVNSEHHSGFLSPDNIAKHCDGAKTEFIELAPGEAALMHNWLMHRSDKNSTAISRRAFSVCYMDGATKSSSGEQFTRLFEAQV